MGLIKNTYGSPEPSLANFDWFDIVTGTGYKDFYGMDLREGADALIYVLTVNTNYYAAIGVYTSGPNTAGEVNLDLDFEVPLTIKGVVLLNAPFTSPGNLGSKTYTFKIYRVDAANAEHQIGSTVTHAVTLNNNAHVNSIKFEIPDAVRFKAGEKFRLSLINPAAAGGSVQWLFDPKDRDVTSLGGGFITSQLRISLPIRI